MKDMKNLINNVQKEQETLETTILRTAELTPEGRIIAYFHFIGMENLRNSVFS